MKILLEWNVTNQPPWKEPELFAKVRFARTRAPKQTPGYMRKGPRPSPKSRTDGLEK
jgi:hypothetical protein